MRKEIESLPTYYFLDDSMLRQFVGDDVIVVDTHHGTSVYIPNATYEELCNQLDDTSVYIIVNEKKRED